MSQNERVPGGWENANEADCEHTARVLEVVGQRWAANILIAVASGAHRFTEITASVDGVSARMLTLRLKQLGTANLVERTVIPTTPVSVRYHLTDQGRDLVAALGSVNAYVRRWDPPLAGGHLSQHDQHDHHRAG